MVSKTPKVVGGGAAGSVAIAKAGNDLCVRGPGRDLGQFGSNESGERLALRGRPLLERLGNFLRDVPDIQGRHAQHASTLQASNSAHTHPGTNHGCPAGQVALSFAFQGLFRILLAVGLEPFMVWSVSLSAEGQPKRQDLTTAKKMRLRYAGVCTSCGADLPVGTPAIYDRASKSVSCLECPTKPRSEVDDVAVPERQLAESSATPSLNAREVDLPPAGVAGASARREFERRRANREQRIRAKHPRLGGLMLAVTDDPQSTKAWAVGAKGEEALGRRLDGLTAPLVRVLHDRRIPRTRANIDHIVICPAGVFVVDAKQYKGRPHLRVDGGFFVPRTEKLMVGSRDCNKLVDGVLKQVDLVCTSVGDETVPVRGFLCFVAADWPLFGGSFTTRGVTALWPRKLAGVMAEPGRLVEDEIRALHDRLAEAFPIA